jgi:formate hydrogenlyase transcriptional activator
VTLSQGTFDGSTRALILRALQAAEWIIGGPSGAAARLGLKRTTLIAKMKKLGISRQVRQVEVAGLNQNLEPGQALAPAAD